MDGSHPAVADYFEREVLNGLPLSDQDFLITSSVLTEPSIEACDQITGDNRSAERLARLGNLHAFLHPSTDGLGYEWVPFAREFLLHRLRLLGDEPELQARRRLLRWCLSQGRYDEAVSRAVETSDWYAIVDLALNAGLDVIGCGRAEDLAGWLEQLPPDVVAAESGVAVVAAMALWVARGDEAGTEIDAWLAQATTSRMGRPPCQAESLSGAIDASRATFSRLEPRTKRLLAQRALLRERGTETAWGALSYAAAGLAAYLDDEPREARRALTQSLHIQALLDVGPRRWISRLFSPCVLGVLALIEIESGGYQDRAEALLSAAELQNHGTAMAGSEIVQLAQGRAALARGDRHVALELSLQTAREAQLTAFKALGYLDAAGIYCEQGQADDSAVCLVEAQRLLDDAPDCGRLLSRRRRAIERQVRLGRAAHWGTTESLTEREIEVLRLLEGELSRREIAEELYLSFETVKTYVQRLYRKLGVSSRSAAVATAHAWGLLDEAGCDDQEATATPPMAVGTGKVPAPLAHRN
ncbi:MAG: LuxR C-terminal-related transcriptional regulator [Acidimicrobiia bacterium]|nr:LuxR C-terminal-related transcriptional regulator [Acidimicrobiia bacterium]